MDANPPGASSQQDDQVTWNSKRLKMNLSSNIFVSAPICNINVNVQPLILSYKYNSVLQVSDNTKICFENTVAAQDAYLSHTWDKPWVSNVTRLAPWSFLLRVLCALSFVEFSFHHNLRIFGDNLDLNHVSVRHHS